ncbi:PIF1-like helicase-domain-containing protein, partial [Lactarius quietus]
MFLSILLYNYPSQPSELWHKYKSHLCDDLSYTLSHKGLSPVTDELAIDYSLHLLQSELTADGNRSLNDVGLPFPTNDWDTLLGNQYILEHCSYDSNKELHLLLGSLLKLNEEQQFAFNSILDSVLHQRHEVYFLKGTAGAGKTFLYNALCHALHSRQLITLCVASSGIAAQLLPGGRTAHSSFKIPLQLDIHSTCSLAKHSSFATFLKSVSLII